MSFDGDDRAAPQSLSVLCQYSDDVFANVSRAYIIETKLNHTGQDTAGLEEQLGKVQILRQHHGAVVHGPMHDLSVRGVGSSQLAPMPNRVPVLTEVLDPRNRQTVVNNDGHAGCSSISRSRVSQAA